MNDNNFNNPELFFLFDKSFSLDNIEINKNGIKIYFMFVI